MWRYNRPATPYEFAQWKQLKVHMDYHVEVDGHYFSVPHTLVGHKLDLRYTATTVEAFHQGQRVACHPRIDTRGRHTTVACHMPPQPSVFPMVTATADRLGRKDRARHGTTGHRHPPQSS